MLNSIIKSFLPKKMLTTKNDSYQLNPMFKREFYFGDKYKRLDVISSDLAEIIARYRLGFNTEFSHSRSSRLIAKYARIELIGQKCEIQRSHILDMCNGLSESELIEWVTLYNSNFDDPVSINKVSKVLDDLYEEINYPSGEESSYTVINRYFSLLEDDSFYNGFLNLFKVSSDLGTYDRKLSKSIIAKLKIYISVFCTMQLDLPAKQSYSLNYIDNDSKLSALVDYLIQHQHDIYHKNHNGKKTTDFCFANSCQNKINS